METTIIIAAAVTVFGIGAMATLLYLLGRSFQKRTINLWADGSIAGGGSIPFAAQTSRTRAPTNAVRVGKPRPPAALEVFGLSKAEAEEWLDWLENHGYQDCQLSFVESGGFAVRHGPGEST